MIRISALFLLFAYLGLSRDLQDACVVSAYAPITSSSPWRRAFSVSSTALPPSQQQYANHRLDHSDRSSRSQSRTQLVMYRPNDNEDSNRFPREPTPNKFKQGIEVFGHLDRFLGCFFEWKSLSSGIAHGTSVFFLNLWKGMILPFPSLRRMLVLNQPEMVPRESKDDKSISVGI